MATDTDTVKNINSRPASNSAGVVIDARERNAAALANNPRFFKNPQRMARVDAAMAIVDNFFPVKKAIYVNYRENRGKPFVVIKVDGCNFPRVTPAVKESTYTKPLADLNVEIKFSSATNSYLYYIR